MGATKIKRGNLTFYPNYKMGAELRRTSIYDDQLRRLAGDAALSAKEIAVKQAFDTGDYFNSIHAELGKNKRGLRVGLVVADDFKANWIEKGYRTIQGQGIRSGDRGRGVRIRNMTGEEIEGLGFVKGKKILARGGRRAGMRVRGPRRRG